MTSRGQTACVTHSWYRAKFDIQKCGFVRHPRTWNAKLGDLYNGPKARHHFTRYAGPHRAHKPSLRIDDWNVHLLFCGTERPSLYFSERYCWKKQDWLEKLRRSGWRMWQKLKSKIAFFTGTKQADRNNVNIIIPEKLKNLLRVTSAL